MATLFTRIVGTEGDKIPLHIFTSLVEEFKAGRVTGPQAQALLGISPTELQDVQWLLQALNAAPEPAALMRAIKNHFYLAEWHGTQDSFATETAFYTKVQDIITEQGGTAPERV